MIHTPVYPSTSTPVLIVGGGPVGLTLAALLGKQGVACSVIEADAGYCVGSRAICVSRRSQEIMGWMGADDLMAKKGLPWTGGRSYWKDTEVLHFQMPTEPTQRFAPMLNIQQYYIEEYAHQAALKTGLVDVQWSSRVTQVIQADNGVTVSVDGPGGLKTIRADWVVACDGGKSKVRELLGLQLQGTQYEGRYVIVDIVQKTKRPVERLAWFDPPSNPGSTLLMHRQPDDVWRIDYQIRDDEDPLEAIKPENVLPRVQSHLRMIGEDEPWEMKWISIYNAKCLSLKSYRHEHVLFAGDAAHLVPIFGVRGLNSGLDDAANLAWKLASVVDQRSPDTLLDSYSQERVQAAQVNMAYGAKSTEFMAPPDFAFKLMREATLRLASDAESVCGESVRSLINPRQSLPITFKNSALNIAEQGEWVNSLAAPGAPAPEAALGQQHLTSYFGKTFVCLMFTAGNVPSDLKFPNLTVLHIPPEFEQAWQRYGLPLPTSQGMVLVRPDGHVMGRWRVLNTQVIEAALQAYRMTP